MFTDKLPTGAFVDSDKCHNRGTIVCKGDLTDKDFFTDKLPTGAFVDSDKCHNRGTIVCKGDLTDKDF